MKGCLSAILQNRGMPRAAAKEEKVGVKEEREGEENSNTGVAVSPWAPGRARGEGVPIPTSHAVDCVESA